MTARRQVSSSSMNSVSSTTSSVLSADTVNTTPHSHSHSHEEEDSAGSDVSPVNTRSVASTAIKGVAKPFAGYGLAGSAAPSLGRLPLSNTNNDGHWHAQELSPKTSATNGNTWQSLSHLQPEALDTPADERDDIFLPLSPPSSAAPYIVAFPTNGLTSPQTPSFMSAADRREHTRRHSRIHSRNLSVFFPRPDQNNGGSPLSISPTEPTHTPTMVDIPTASVRAYQGVNRSTADWRAAQPSAASANVVQDMDSAGGRSRRGHHHRHSMSHKCAILILSRG